MATAECDVSDKIFSIHVEFDMVVKNLANNYASHPITHGKDLHGSGCVWCIYVFGKNSDNLNGQFAIVGQSIKHGEKRIGLAPQTKALKLNKLYHIKWIYNETVGGALYIDGQMIKNPIEYQGPLDGSRSNTIILKDNVYNGRGRQHSKFDGNISNLMIKYNNIEGNMNNVGNDDIREKININDELENKENVKLDSDLQQIYSILKDLKIDKKYFEIFKNEEFTMKSFLLLKPEDLKSLNIKYGPRLLIQQYIDQQNTVQQSLNTTDL